MGTYLISLPIVPVAVSEVYTQLPLQCTVFQYFSTTKDLDVLRRELRYLCANTKPIEIIGGEPALFGPLEDVPVNRVEETPELRDLHAAAGTLLAELAATIHEPAWSGDGYRPHVSKVNGVGFGPEQRVIVDRLSLVSKLDTGRKKIVAMFPFG